ncbi:MAG: hypothetical protein RMA76_38720 [Deltaproteobacteria bacterium]|jgi:hypothetical protein
MNLRGALAKVPWPVWLALVPAIGIGLNEIRKGGRLRVEVAGAGPVALLAEAPAPDGLRWGMDANRSASLADTVANVEKMLALHPGIVVFGIDADPVARGELDAERVKQELAKLAVHAHRSATVTVIVQPHALIDPTPEGAAALEAIDAWWRQDVCRIHRRLRCVSLEGRDPATLRAAMHAAIVDAVRHLDQLRATTQVGR